MVLNPRASPTLFSGARLRPPVKANAIAWLKLKGTKTQKLVVAAGNETIIEYYKQLDFYPLHIILQKK